MNHREQAKALLDDIDEAYLPNIVMLLRMVQKDMGVSALNELCDDMLRANALDACWEDKNTEDIVFGLMA